MIGDFLLIAVKKNLKCVLLHNDNVFESIPLGHSTTIKENYIEIKFVLKKISYYKHNQIIGVGLKMVGFLFSLQCTVVAKRLGPACRN